MEALGIARLLSFFTGKFRIPRLHCVCNHFRADMSAMLLFISKSIARTFEMLQARCKERLRLHPLRSAKQISLISRHTFTKKSLLLFQNFIIPMAMSLESFASAYQNSSVAYVLFNCLAVFQHLELLSFQSGCLDLQRTRFGTPP